MDKIKQSKTQPDSVAVVPTHHREKPKVDIERELEKLKKKQRSRSRSHSPTTKALIRAQKVIQE